ncbi:unnamed protein product [Larinioides sclopetarius]|uniref:Glycine-rich protein n=1 Tax=Larinioides sclopetarius TaxID=280406 RepID=A0AAV2A2J2_9ARAC
MNHWAKACRNLSKGVKELYEDSGDTDEESSSEEQFIYKVPEMYSKRRPCYLLTFLLLAIPLQIHSFGMGGGGMSSLGPLMMMMKKSGMKGGGGGGSGVMELLAAGLVVKMLQGLKLPNFMKEDNSKIVAVPVVLNQGGMMSSGGWPSSGMMMSGGWPSGGMMGGGWPSGGMMMSGGWPSGGMMGGGGYNSGGGTMGNNGGGMMGNGWKNNNMD